MTHESNSLSPELFNRLLAKSSAVAAILRRGEFIVTKAGALSADAFSTAEAVLKRNYPMEDRRKVERYVGVVLDRRYHFIYASWVGEGDALLSLIFPIKTSLTRMRQEMGEALRTIRQQMSSDGDRAAQRWEQSLQSVGLADPNFENLPPTERIPSGWQPEIESPLAGDQEIKGAEKGISNLSGQEANKPELPAPQVSDATPSPDLDTLMADIPWQPIGGEGWADLNHGAEPRHADEPMKAEPVDDMSQPVNDEPTWQPLKEITPETGDLISILQENFELGRDLPAREASFPPVNQVDEARHRAGIDPSLADTVPIGVNGEGQQGKGDRIADITFYLAPRLNEHYLLGELAHRLRSWMPAICEAYGWQIVSLSLRPDYIKWTLQDFPESLLREMLQIVRRETSQRIFRVFPNLRADKASRDFWSPGYLVDTQNQAFSTRALMVRISTDRLGDNPAGAKEIKSSDAIK